MSFRQLRLKSFHRLLARRGKFLLAARKKSIFASENGEKNLKHMARDGESSSKHMEIVCKQEWRNCGNESRRKTCENFFPLSRSVFPHFPRDIRRKLAELAVTLLSDWASNFIDVGTFSTHGAVIFVIWSREQRHWHILSVSAFSVHRKLISSLDCFQIDWLCETEPDTHPLQPEGRWRTPRARFSSQDPALSDR